MIYYKDNDMKIRDIKDEDAVYLFQWWTDREINKFDPRPLPSTSRELLKECYEFCKRLDNEVLNEDIKTRKYRYFIIVNHEEQPIGFVNFFSMDKHKKQGEMGVIIGDKRYWNRGIASKAVDTAVSYIFENFGMERIYIETGETNIPALKLFEKLNFRKCGEYLEEDDFKFIQMDKVKAV